MKKVNTAEYEVKKESLLPTSVIAYSGVDNSNLLLHDNPKCVSFKTEPCVIFGKKGAFVLLDFGKEICGGIRIITRMIQGADNTLIRITFGESVTEACSSVNDSTATNDHSPRDFTAILSTLSDLTFGATGFRFVRIELTDDTPLHIFNVFAESTEPYFKREAYIKTSDTELNKIIDTAAYTLRLNLQNGYIWDGIKRDRLVWCGDLHQEIINAMYLFGDNKYITNSLEFLKNDTPSTEWINYIPTYSAWWVINLCDYYKLSGNTQFFEENKTYAKDVLKHIDDCIDANGKMAFNTTMDFFLDWPTFETSDAEIGTASLLMLAANKFFEIEENPISISIVKKLKRYLDLPCRTKQTRAFQILAGRKPNGEDEFLESGGAQGFSTFMAYYILTADFMAGGNNAVSIIKEYFGAMLSRGATTFWEDFDVSWLENSGRIDEFPKENQLDIHADFGNYCYKGLRHSLCHGWSSGVLAFVIESLFGIQITNSGKKVIVNSKNSNLDFDAKIPLRKGWLNVKCRKNKIDVKAPENVTVVLQ